MENNKGQTLFMSIVGVATLLVAVIGATFAYFSIGVTGNNTASSINVTTATLSNIVFNDGSNAINATNIYPGWYADKTFTVTSGAGNADFEYTVKLKPGTTKTLAGNQDFVYIMTSVPSGCSAAGTTSTTTATAPTGTKYMVKTTEDAIGTCTIQGGNTHTWTIRVALVETGSDQNSLQGKGYQGTIQVYATNTTNGGQYTWDNANSKWKAYSAS